MTRPLDMNEAAKRVIGELKDHANPFNVEGMKRYGISTDNALGVSMPIVRDIARRTGRNHELAQLVWESNYHEARILAGLIDEPSKVTFEQMESWVMEVDSWDVCDQLCSNLFDKTAHAYHAATTWCKREEAFVKRSGYVLMATLAVHDKKAADEIFLEFLALIEEGSVDDRNFVKKAVNWALRQIGKRNLALHRAAINMARHIEKKESNSARWIAKDALRELTNEATIARLKNKANVTASSHKT
jgi:3-methyladenine DNA glycosylase AlkD